MTLDQFKTHYALNISLLDDDHWVLISTMNAIYDAEQRADTVKVAESAEELLKLLSSHIVREEQYMTTINYPFIEYHKVCHIDLMRKMSTLLTEMRGGNKPHRRMQDDLYTILVAHVDAVDLQISTFVKAQALAA